MTKLLRTQFNLGRCPHCNVDTPTLGFFFEHKTIDYSNTNQRFWRFYQCSRCGGVITAAAKTAEGDSIEIYPSGVDVDGAIPDRAREYLNQAINS